MIPLIQISSFCYLELGRSNHRRRVSDFEHKFINHERAFGSCSSVGRFFEVADRGAAMGVSGEFVIAILLNSVWPFRQTINLTFVLLEGLLICPTTKARLSREIVSDVLTPTRMSPASMPALLAGALLCTDSIKMPPRNGVFFSSERTTSPNLIPYFFSHHSRSEYSRY